MKRNQMLIKNVIEEIAQQCLQETELLGEEYIDLYGGKSGIAIFFASLYQFNKKDIYKDQTYKLISDALNNINHLANQGSLSGISGVLWTLQYLVNIGFFRYEEVDEYINRLKSKIVGSINFDKENKNYDLMHGLLGKLMALKSVYLNNKDNHPEILVLLRNSIHYLDRISIKIPDQSKLYWTSPFGEQYIITGMAHGVSSIIWFLSELINDKIFADSENKLITELITGASNWLINDVCKESDKELIFPTKVCLNQYSKKNYMLAWCHGDLGIAVALIKAGTVLRDKNLANEGLRVAENAAQLKVVNSNIHQDKNNIDCTLCHGIYGIFLIFYLLHKRTGSQLLKTAYEYWLTIITESFDPSKRCCNLVYAYPDQNNKIKWNSAPGLLSGLSGNGLILLTYSHLENETEPTTNYNWFDIFL